MKIKFSTLRNALKVIALALTIVFFQNCDSGIKSKSYNSNQGSENQFNFGYKQNDFNDRKYKESAENEIFKATDVDRCSYIDDLLNDPSVDIADHITDVILTAGQSNAVANKTKFQPETVDQDTIDSRLLVWTEHTSGDSRLNHWQVADPRTQVWDFENKEPHWDVKIHNHPAFQIGKSILKKNPCKIIAMITTAAPGMPITHWLNNVNNHYAGINSKVNQALDALKNINNVDMIWWMQGESDDGVEFNTQKANLNKLIQDFRSLPWFNNDGYFLANETRRSYNVNKVIRSLASDGDQTTDYSLGEASCLTCSDYPSIASEAPKTHAHFNEVAFRRIGVNVSNKYFNYKK